MRWEQRRIDLYLKITVIDERMEEKKTSTKKIHIVKKIHKV